MGFAEHPLLSFERYVAILQKMQNHEAGSALWAAVLREAGTVNAVDGVKGTPHFLGEGSYGCVLAVPGTKDAVVKFPLCEKAGKASLRRGFPEAETARQYYRAGELHRCHDMMIMPRMEHTDAGIWKHTAYAGHHGAELVQQVQEFHQRTEKLHMDIKMSNMGMLEDGSIRLLDFGSAASFHEATVFRGGEHTASGNCGFTQYCVGPVVHEYIGRRLGTGCVSDWDSYKWNHWTDLQQVFWTLVDWYGKETAAYRSEWLDTKREFRSVMRGEEEIVGWKKLTAEEKLSWRREQWTKLAKSSAPILKEWKDVFPDDGEAR